MAPETLDQRNHSLTSWRKFLPVIMPGIAMIPITLLSRANTELETA
jgi:hypothetical protein